MGPHRALMQTYLDDSMQPGGQDGGAPAAAGAGATSSVGTAGDGGGGGGSGSGLPQVA